MGKESAANFVATKLVVTQYLVEGKGIKEIASEMDLTITAVSKLKRRIFSKLGVEDQLELTRKASLLKNFW